LLKILQVQTFKECLGVFLVTLGSLLGLIMIGRMMRLRDLLLSQDISGLEMAELFLYLTPYLLIILLPVTCMLSVFLAFLRMSTDRRILAAKASGISLYQMLPAAILFCLLCMAITFWVSLHGIGWGMGNFRGKVLEFARTKTQLMIQPGVFNTDFPGLTIYARNVDSTTHEMSHVFVRDDTSEDIQTTILAPRGKLETDPDRAQILFLLTDGRMYRRGENALDILKFGNYVVRLDLVRLTQGLAGEEIRAKESSIGRLWDRYTDPELRKQNPFIAKRAMTELHRRFAVPVSCLVLGVFALPFAVAFQGLRQYLGVLLVMGFFLFYNALFSVGWSMSETGQIPPELGLWIPNVLFLVVGILGVALTAQEKSVKVLVWLSHLRFRRRDRGEA
jgi:lipopolysaccharide export system permease protein